MRLLHIAAEINPELGGVSRAIQTMIDGLSHSDVHNEVVCLDNPDAPFLKNIKFPVYALGPAKSSWCYSPYLIPWLVKNYSRFDVVIIHGLWLYHGFAARKALQKIVKGRINTREYVYPKLYIMPHGMLDPYFQKAAGRQLKALRNWIYWKLIEKKLINSAEALLFTCNLECDLAEKAFLPYSPNREVVVGLGVEDPPVYNATMRETFLKRCPEMNGDPFLLYLGRIDEKKGVDMLIAAYISLAEKEEQAPKLLIAGPGLQTAYGKRMLQTVSENKYLINKIFFPGMLSGDAKWGAFYNCEAFVLPSHQENFGIAVVEAMACGKPVLITDQVNIYREIQEAAGAIIGKDTPEGIYQLIKSWIILSDIERQTMGLNAQNLYRTYYTVKFATKRLLSAIIKN